MLEVADRGPGVPQAMRERVFERFARGGGDAAPGGGSGLGLAIVRAVAEAHGGRVELGDAEGGGARFVVTLPAADAYPLRSPRASVLVEPRAGTRDLEGALSVKRPAAGAPRPPWSSR